MTNLVAWAMRTASGIALFSLLLLGLAGCGRPAATGAKGTEAGIDSPSASKSTAAVPSASAGVLDAAAIRSDAAVSAIDVQSSAAGSFIERPAAKFDANLPESAVRPLSAELASGSETTSESKICGPNPDAVASFNSTSTRRYVNVSVATLWRTPGSPRQVDAPSLRAPADIPAWLAPQSIADKLQLVGRTETEALYGETVELLEEHGEWARVAVLAQRTPLNAHGYPGWLPKRQLTERSASAAYVGCSQVLVTKPTAWLYADAALQLPRLQLSFGTRLPIVGAYDGTLQVATPDGTTAWLNAADVLVREPNAAPEPPTGEQLIALGRQFIGLSYLWAGASGFGFDCSGFTYSLYRYYGIELPRDAKDQAKAGRAVDKQHLQPGDLLFFAYDKGKGAVHHVALYAGGGMMLHSPKTERTVELIPLATPEYAGEFASARRLLPDERQ